MKIKKTYSTHLPLLIAIMAEAKEMTGDVLELGMGLFSTPFLHWSCFQKRKLVSYDNEADYFESNKGFEDTGHEVHFVTDWSKINIEKPWDVVFVDHHPDERRKEEVRRLANYAKFIVVHDVEGKRDSIYRFSEIYPLFKYRFVYDKARPHTAVLSNFVDVTKLKI